MSKEFNNGVCAGTFMSLIGVVIGYIIQQERLEKLKKRSDELKAEHKKLMDDLVNTIDFEALDKCRNRRLEESIKRARNAGVPEDKIIHNEEEGYKFFMGD